MFESFSHKLQTLFDPTHKTCEFYFTCTLGTSQEPLGLLLFPKFLFFSSPKVFVLQRRIAALLADYKSLAFNCMVWKDQTGGGESLEFHSLLFHLCAGWLTMQPRHTSHSGGNHIRRVSAITDAAWDKLKFSAWLSNNPAAELEYFSEVGWNPFNMCLDSCVKKWRNSKYFFPRGKTNVC